jgi:hypothetical protein
VKALKGVLKWQKVVSMRADILRGRNFPDYELSDHTAKHRKLSELQGQHPMVLVLSRGGYCPKDRRQSFRGRPTIEDLRQDLRAVSEKCRPDWDITRPERRAAWQQGRKDNFYPYGKT